MNTLKLISLTVITACLIFSCSSDDSPAKIDSKLIIGTWKWTKSSKSGNAVTLTACELLDTVIFTDMQFTYISNSEGTTTVCKSDTSISAYSISDNVITKIDQSGTNTREIVTLDSTTLVMKSEEIDGNKTYEYLNTYTKQ